MVDDASLQTSVIDALNWDPSFDAAHIGVSAKCGIVTLTGFVESYAAKVAVERATRRVRGVKAIAEEIEVRLPNHQMHADDEIAARIVQIFSWDVQVPAALIQVKVEHGVVTLSGDVRFHFERSAAERDVRQLGGVVDVLNLIRVSPIAAGAVDDATLEKRIATALHRHAEIDATSIKVDVEAGKATLRGHVRSWFERTIAENAVWAAPGVLEVQNKLAVQH